MPDYPYKAAEIRRLVALHWHVRPLDLSGPRRIRSFSRPRTIAMALCRLLTSMSYPEIGKFFKKDHSTVISAERRFLELLAQSDRDVLDTVRHVRANFVPDVVDPRLRHVVSTSSTDPTHPDPFVEATADLRGPQTQIPGTEREPHGNR